jgi:hypothetical protein
MIALLTIADPYMPAFTRFFTNRPAVLRLT